MAYPFVAEDSFDSCLDFDLVSALMMDDQLTRFELDQSEDDHDE
jgi:hypothetical protein